MERRSGKSLAGPRRRSRPDDVRNGFRCACSYFTKRVDWLDLRIEVNIQPGETDIREVKSVCQRSRARTETQLFSEAPSLRTVIAKWWQPAFEFVQGNRNWIGILLSFTAGAAAVWAIYRCVDYLAEAEFRDGTLSPIPHPMAQKSMLKL